MIKYSFLKCKILSYKIIIIKFIIFLFIINNLTKENNKNNFLLLLLINMKEFNNVFLKKLDKSKNHYMIYFQIN